MATQKIFTPKEAVERLEKLPPEIREVIYSPEMTAALMSVGEKEKLHLDQMAKLEAETSAVMLGFTESQDFPAMISEKLAVDNEKANAIAKDMDEILFSKIRGAMKTTDAKATVMPITPSNNPPAMDMAPAMPGKSVVMPSAMAALTATPTPSTPAVPKPAPTAPTMPLSTDMQIDAPAGFVPAQTATPAVPTAPASGTSAPLHEADVMLSEPTVSLPVVNQQNPPTKVEATPPPTYKADPYREPIE